MLKKFLRECDELSLGKPDERILLAISGGIDSMVLLHLMLKLREKTGCEIAVAHADHDLRPESKAEGEYLRAFCEAQQLPFFLEKWEHPSISPGGEAQARTFRYGFFSRVMREHQYATLLTAHHGDDQAETVLMKLVRGSRLANLAAIKQRQPFESGELIRPLLIFSKEELQLFANDQDIVYFEDSTNQSDVYFRNRIRQRIIPQLKEDNPGFLKHMANFTHQVSLADELINSLMTEKFVQWVAHVDSGYRLNVAELKKQLPSVQYFFLQHVLQQTLIPEGIEINQDQVGWILDSIQGDKPQQTITLEKGWTFVKSYEIAYLMHPKLPRSEQGEVQSKKDANMHHNVQAGALSNVRSENKAESGVQVYQLQENQSIFLSETQWLALEVVSDGVVPPKHIQDWPQQELIISSEIPLPLRIRHREDGDRIALTPLLKKRLNRLFIDQKVPNALREDAWVILSADNEVIWVPYFANSYLSIPQETDKIHYRLLYRTKEET